jgi:flagellar hook assembly protein FlgD
VQLLIYDLNGRLVKKLRSEEQAAGEHLARWDGRESNGNVVAAGVYVYRLIATPASGKETVLVRKMTFMK